MKRPHRKRAISPELIGFTRRRDLIPADQVRDLRARLGFTQARLAHELGVTRRTIIRGEQHGLELPWRSDSTRAAVWENWKRLSAITTESEEASQ